MENEKKHVTMVEMFHLIYNNKQQKEKHERKRKKMFETIGHAQIPNGMHVEYFQIYWV